VVQPVAVLREDLVAVVILVGQIPPVIPALTVWVAEQVEQDIQPLVLN